MMFPLTVGHKAQPPSPVLLLKWNIVFPGQMISGKSLKCVICCNVMKARWTSESGKIIIILCMVQGFLAFQIAFEKGQNVNGIRSSRQHSDGAAFLACSPTLKTTVLSVIVIWGLGQRWTIPSVTLIPSSNIPYCLLLLAISIPPSHSPSRM